MTRTTRRRSRPVVALVAGAIGLTALLAGCAAEEPEPTSTPSLPAETTPPPTPTETPTPTAAATEPAAPGVDAPLDAVDAYALCRSQTTQYYGDPGRLVFAPFDEATVLLRDDGDWYIYMEVDDPSAGDLAEAAGSECIVGGTIGEPVWQLYGTVARAYADESIADYNRPPTEG